MRMHVVLNTIAEERKRRYGGHETRVDWILIPRIPVKVLLDQNGRTYSDVEAARDSQDQSCDHLLRVDVIFQVTGVDLLRYNFR